MYTFWNRPRATNNRAKISRSFPVNWETHPGMGPQEARRQNAAVCFASEQSKTATVWEGPHMQPCSRLLAGNHLFGDKFRG